jgi:hypothetical protein
MDLRILSFDGSSKTGTVLPAGYETPSFSGILLTILRESLKDSPKGVHF